MTTTSASNQDLLMYNDTSMTGQNQEKGETENLNGNSINKKDRNNAILLKIKSKKALPKQLKEGLKKNYKCHFNEALNCFSCPIENKDIIKGLLESSHVEAELKEALDPYFNASKNEQQADRLITRADFLQKEIEEKERCLLSRIFKYRSELRPEDFEEPPSQGDKPEAQFHIELGFHQEVIQLKKFKNEREEILNEVNRLLTAPKSIEELVVEELNQRHATATISGQFFILTEVTKPSTGWLDIELWNKASFKSEYENKIPEGSEKTKAEIWLKHPKRREFKGIIFDPSQVGHINGYYNLFRGFSAQPIKGDCSLYWQLLKEGICNNSETKYRYCRRWISHLFQKPWELPETALAFRGLEGIGKGTILRYLRILAGNHYQELSQMNQVVGRFNSHLKDALLVYANEAVWGGDKSAVGALKAMITDPIQPVESKGKDIISVRNYKRIIFSSNEDWIVPRGIDDRRFFVLDCSSQFKEDHLFFNELSKQMDIGGLEALMFDLMNEDLTNWHPRQMPIIADGFDLKVKSMGTPHQWLYEALKEGKILLMEFDEQKSQWPESNDFKMSKKAIYSDYKLYCQDLKQYSHNHQTKTEKDGLFWKKIYEILGNIEAERGREFTGSTTRIQFMHFPSLSDGRILFEKFSKSLGCDIWDS